jgi:hypothetical protein
MQVDQLRRHVAALWQRRRMACQPTARQNLGDIGYADTQHGRDPADRFTIVSRCEHSLSKIL